MAPRARAGRAAGSAAANGTPMAGIPAVRGGPAVAGPADSAARPRLTRQKVLRAALEFVDANGLAALSMHKLGAELGVRGMSLYSHVASKDALLDGIVEAMTSEAEMPPADGADWRGARRPPARAIRGGGPRPPAPAPPPGRRSASPT